VRKTLQEYYSDATQKLNEFKSSEAQVAASESSNQGWSTNELFVTTLAISNVISALALGKYYSENQSLQTFKTGFLEEF